MLIVEILKIRMILGGGGGLTDPILVFFELRILISRLVKSL